MQRRHRTARVRGFSLVEAMAALVVFTIGILGVLQMNVLASQQNGLARRQATASKMARDLVDAFERLPFEHPVLSTESDLAHTDPRFEDFEQMNGRMLLSDAVTLAGVRPLLGAAHASMSTEDVYEVAWRVAPVQGADGTKEARRILVMVRFPSTAGNHKQVNVWAVKYNPQAIGRGTSAVPEI